ncbi:MAG: hypothetical protein FKY71_18310 [Spiribacter salinus]|uniref:Uncharacterized protein n=1 Tax=Spiribacter salinus TaxID=1335746 RepID=A0A540V8Y6_9GAMM|nr:MAG: hypothetical protein FKY71_18310 [Spiribacter salinus]
MSLKNFCENHKGVRRSIVVVMSLWISAAVGVGLYRLTELTAESNTFLLAVLGLLSVPIGFYFHTRGKE